MGHKKRHSASSTYRERFHAIRNFLFSMGEGGGGGGGASLTKQTWEYQRTPRIILQKSQDFLGSLSFIKCLLKVECLKRYGIYSIAVILPLYDSLIIQIEIYFCKQSKPSAR